MTVQSYIVVSFLVTVFCCSQVLCDAEATYTTNGISQLNSSPSQPHLIHNTSALSKAALLSIFAKYGQNGSLQFEGFEHLLESLGLGNIVITDHNISDHHNVEGSWSVALHDPHHVHAARVTESADDGKQAQQHHAHGDDAHGDHAHGDHDHNNHDHSDHTHSYNTHDDHAHGDNTHSDHAHGDHAHNDQHRTSSANVGRDSLSSRVNCCFRFIYVAA